MIVYIYFRTLSDKSTMVILNNSDRSFNDFDLTHYHESLNGFTGGADILTEKKYNSCHHSFSPKHAISLAKHFILSYIVVHKMRLIFSIVLLQISLTALGQNLLDVALTNKSSIIISEPTKINLREHSFYINSYMEYINHRETVLSDTSIIRNFIRLSQSQDTTQWKTEDFNKRLVISENEKINVKKAFNTLGALSEVEAKALKKEFRQYNNRSGSWRSYPIRVSKPIFSEDNKYALIAVVRGNEGSEISLFELNRDNWIHLGYLERKAF